MLCPRPIWQVQWDITYACNLGCSYCLVPRERDRRDSVDGALAAMGPLAPRNLIVSGGEPTVLERFAEFLRATRAALPDTSIFVNTNGLNIEPILQVRDELDGVFVSLDGVGAVNRRQRGVRGERVLAALRRLQAARRTTGRPPVLEVVPVVTVASLPLLGQLLEEVQRIGDDIEVLAKPRLPYSHPESIAATPEGRTAYARFWEEHRGRFNLWMHGVATPIRPDPRTPCLAQLFFARLDPRDRLGCCRLYDDPGPGGDGRVTLRPCPAPCDCKEWIDEILFGTSPDDCSQIARFALQVLGPDGLATGEAFVREHVDPGFRLPLLRAAPR
jgi:pyruvate-formate lyase-activating enzyme